MVGLAVTVAVAACGPDGAATACGPIVSDRLDAGSLVHVLPGAPPPSYLVDPPTSGPHVVGPAVEGVQDDALDPPVQVGILERGDILIQHRDLADADRARLEALAGPQVVVAPNPDLPDRIVATAWTTRRSCEAVDVDALAEFVDARAGRGPDQE